MVVMPATIAEESSNILSSAILNILSFPELSQESPMAIIRRKQKMHERAEARRKKRRMIMKACLGAVLVLMIFRQYHSHSKEATLQSAAYILLMAG